MQNIQQPTKNQKSTIVGIYIFIIILSSVLTFSLPVFIIQILMGSFTLPLILKKDSKMARLYLIIFLVSIIYIFLVYHGNKLYYGKPYYMGGSDDLKFENWGHDIVNANTYMPHKVMKQGILGMFHNSPFYAVLIAMLINISNLFGGYNTFLPRIMNIYFLIWVCMLFETLIKQYTNISKDKLVYIIGGFALMPNIQYINSHVFRDTFNLLQVFLLIYLFDKVISSKKVLVKMLSLTGFTILTYFTYYTRVNSLAFIAMIILLMLTEKYKIKKRYLIILMIPIILMGDILKIFKIQHFIETYWSYVSNIAGDGLSSIVFGRPLLPFGIILRFIYAFIIPFPNFMGLFKQSSGLLFDFVNFLIYLGVLIQITMSPFVIKRIFKFDWLSFAFSGWFMAVIITTFTFRHVVFYYPFMVAMAVDGYTTTTRKQRKTILFLSVFTAICFGLIYIFLKLL